MLKKKLNGSMFRGVKVRIEDARPDTFVDGGVPDPVEDDGKRKRKREEKEKEKEGSKRKKNGAVKGIELPEGRRVQRGWTKPPAISTPAAGKDSKRECLFRTSTASLEKSEKDKKKKKSRGEKALKEFTHNTKFPQFLKTNQLSAQRSNTVTEYVDGVGWINGRGEVIERSMQHTTADSHMDIDEPSTPTPQGKGSAASPPYREPANASDSDSDVTDVSPITPKTPHAPSPPPQSSSSKRSKAQTPTLQITIPRIVHPLEALYKPTTATPGASSSAISPTDTSSFRFSFVDDEDDDGDGEVTVSTPPHRYRSAAPTPDTAIGNRRFFPPDEDDVPELGGGRLFVPSTPRVIGDSDRRRSSVVEAPLLGPHDDSRFLGALNVWSRIPPSKTLEGEPEQDMEAGNETDKDLVERWRQTFYTKRGEWNREYKKRRRDAKRKGGVAKKPFA